MSRQFATDCHWQPRDLRFETCIYHGLSSLTLRGTERAQEAAACHYLLHNFWSEQTCHLLWSKECCVYAFAFPSQWTHLAFPADHPIGRFWPSKITFWGWLYAIHCQSKLQLCAEMARKQPEKRRGERMCTMRAWWQRGWRPAKLTAVHGFLEQPFRETDKQQNIPLV